MSYAPSAGTSRTMSIPCHPPAGWCSSTARRWRAFARRRRHVEQEDIEARSRSLTRAREIIGELLATLDFEAGGSVARQSRRALHLVHRRDPAGRPQAGRPAAAAGDHPGRRPARRLEPGRRLIVGTAPTRGVGSDRPSRQPLRHRHAGARAPVAGHTPTISTCWMPSAPRMRADDVPLLSALAVEGSAILTALERGVRHSAGAGPAPASRPTARGPAPSGTDGRRAAGGRDRQGRHRSVYGQLESRRRSLLGALAGVTAAAPLTGPPGLPRPNLIQPADFSPQVLPPPDDSEVQRVSSQGRRRPW